jgi:hypothetical protein
LLNSNIDYVIFSFDIVVCWGDHLCGESIDVLGDRFLIVIWGDRLFVKVWIF